LRIKEQETHLNLLAHDDDDGDDNKLVIYLGEEDVTESELNNTNHSWNSCCT
jgi:hypothetical protein